MKTSKQKARELYDEFYKLYVHQNSTSVRHDLTIKSCKIALKYLFMSIAYTPSFWVDVEEEINNIK